MPFVPTDKWREEVKLRVVELPLARKRRFMESYHLPASDAQTFIDDVLLGDYFSRVSAQSNNPKAVANWVINNLRAKLTESGTTLGDIKFKENAIPELIALVESGKISTRIAQDVFADMFATGDSPAQIVEKKGLVQVSDTGAIEKLADEVIAANPRSVEDYKAGKVAALNFLKGQMMKLSKGKANPTVAGEILERKLKV